MEAQKIVVTQVSCARKMIMKISKNTRVARAGTQMAKAIVEMVHLLYLNDNALEFLQAILKGLNQEFKTRSSAQKKNRIGSEL